MIKSHIVAIEGFDMVGKDYVIKNYKDHDLPNLNYYRPDYTLFDSMFSRNDAWVIGYSIIDYLSKSNLVPSKSVYYSDNITCVGFNRFIVSSLVYSELYGGTLHTIENLREIYKYYSYESLKEKGFDLTIYHIKHSDISSAMKMMITSKDRSDNEPLDNFKTFETYWMMYEDAEKLFKKYYDLLGYTNHVKVIVNKFDSKK